MVVATIERRVSLDGINVIYKENSPFFVPNYLLNKYNIEFENNEIDKESYDFLFFLNQIHLCKKKSLDLLAIRDHSCFELKNKLRQRKFKIEVIDEVFLYLKEKNYLNDERFCEIFLKSRINKKPEGKIILLKRLQQKGVSYSLAENIYEKIIDEEKEVEICNLAYEKAYRKYGEDLDRIKQYLTRSGFSYYLIKEIISNMS